MPRGREVPSLLHLLKHGGKQIVMRFFILQDLFEYKSRCHIPFPPGLFDDLLVEDNRLLLCLSIELQELL